MEAQLVNNERENKRKSRIITIAIHSLLLLLIFFYTFPAKKVKPMDPPPVTVEFDFRESSLSKYARAEEGSMRKKSTATAAPKSTTKKTKTKTTKKTTVTKPIEQKVTKKVTPVVTKKVTKPVVKKPVVKKVSTKKVVTKTPTPVVTRKPTVQIKRPKPNMTPIPEPVISETTVKESPIVIDSSPEVADVEVEPEVMDGDIGELEPETEMPTPEATPSPEMVEQEVLTDADLAELEEEATVKENKSDVSSEWDGNGKSKDNPNAVDNDGNGTGKGEKGSGPGASKGPDKDHGEGKAGSGTGEYDGSGNGVFGRKIVHSNWREILRGAGQSRGKGKIAVKFCVNRAGDVVYSEIIEAETTETDPSKLRQALKAAWGYKLEPKASAPEEQCGKLKFNLNINALR